MANKKLEQELSLRVKGKINYWDSEGKVAEDLRPNLQTIETLLDPECDVFSILFYADTNFSKKVFNNPKLFKKSLKTHRSPLDQRTTDNLWRDNNQLNSYLEETVKEKYNKVRGDDDFFECLDKVAVEVEKEYKKKALKDLLQEYFLDYLDSYNRRLARKLNEVSAEELEEEMEKYFKKNPSLKRKLEKTIKSSTKETHYERIYKYQLPKNLAEMIAGYTWQQFYFMKKGKDLSYARGCPTGSGTRETHGFFGHLFAIVQNQGRKIPTYIAYFDKSCKLHLHKLDELVLHEHDLTGNYRIDREDSEVILRNIRKVYGIGDLIG